MNFISAISINALLIMLVMTIAWFICVKIKNFGFVDFIWSASFAIVTLGYWLLTAVFEKPLNPEVGPFQLRRILFLFMVCGWSLRLATHLFKRLKSHHPIEDIRYVELRKKWAGPSLNSKFFVFFQFQAITVVLLTAPFYFILKNSASTISLLEVSGFTLWLVALVGESKADSQLKAFKANPKNKGQVCDQGLWKYSRHPNYFFEWFIWIGYFVFSLSSPMGWVSIYCPILMYFFLTKVTGIPITEELSLRSKGEIYRQYQLRTSAFFLWPPKS